MNRKSLSERIGKVRLKEESQLDRYYKIWALTRENLSSGFADNKGADQPVLPRSPISTFVIHLLEIISRLAMSDISIFYVVSVAKETCLSLALLETRKAGIVAMRPI